MGVGNPPARRNAEPTIRTGGSCPLNRASGIVFGFKGLGVYGKGTGDRELGLVGHL